MPELHHPFGPSSLKRRELCPGSYRMEQLCKDVDNGDELATRGTKIHAAIAAYINGNDYAGEPLNEEESAILASLVDFWEDFKARLPEGSIVEAERRIQYTSFNGVLYYGTADVVIKCPDNTVRIIDWKTGYRKVDDAAENLQGAAYALAAYQQWLNPRVVEVTFYNPTIHQLSRHEFTSYMLANVHKYLYTIITSGMKPDAPCVPGEEQCRDCKAAKSGTCVEFVAHHTATSELACKNVRIAYTEMPDGTLAEIWERCKLVKQVKSAVEAEMKKRIEAGGSCAGYTIKETSSGRECKDILALFEAVSDTLDQPEFLKCCTASVSQVEKAYAKAAKTLGLHPTEKAAREAFQSETAGIVAEKAPSKSIVKEG